MNSGQSFTVPQGTIELSVLIAGSKGTENNCNAGKGALISATLHVTPGETLYLYVDVNETTVIILTFMNNFVDSNDFDFKRLKIPFC